MTRKLVLFGSAAVVMGTVVYANTTKKATPSDLYAKLATGVCTLVVTGNSNPIWQDASSAARQAKIISSSGIGQRPVFANNNCDNPSGTIDRVAFD